MKLSEPRRKLLEVLIAVEGGNLPAKWLSIPTRNLASRMQRGGLVMWKASIESNRHSLKGQTLYITSAGRRALNT